MNIEIIQVSPKQAETWLKKNTQNNRKLQKRLVNQYSRDMILGKWEMTGEAIKFDKNETLIDGQHRLSAVVASNKTVTMAVVTGLDHQVVQVIDTGRQRSAGDALTVAGKGQYANNVAALARKIIGYRGGSNEIMGGSRIQVKGQVITNREIIAFCTQHDLTSHVAFAFRMCQNQVATIFTNGEWSFLHWLLSQLDQKSAEDFLHRLATLENVGRAHPIRVLFEKITKGSTDLTPKQRLQATILAWNAYRKGELMTVIRIGRMDTDEIPVAI